MPTIVMASPKGGCGKTTAAIILATELALRNASVEIIDADPNEHVTDWARKPGKPDRLTVTSSITDDNMIPTLETARRRAAFVLVDLEGTANLRVAQAMSRADLVLIPTKGSALDAKEALRTVRFVKLQEVTFSKRIPFALLYTQTSPAVRSRTLKGIEADMLDAGIPALSVALHERDAYRALFSFGGSLDTLRGADVANLAAAKANAAGFMEDVMARMEPVAA